MREGGPSRTAPPGESSERGPGQPPPDSRSVRGGPSPTRAVGTRDLLFPISAAVLVLAFAFVYRGFVQDDAYITYRYARNLAMGRGFVYNPGEHVLGTSTPLYTLMLAGLSRLTSVPVPTVALAVGMLCLWGSSLAMYNLGKPAGRPFAVLTALLLLTSPFLRHMIGMEAFLLVALLLLSTWAYTVGHREIASILLGALVLTRYELVFFAGLIGLADWRLHRRPPRWLWPAAAMLGAWLIAATLYFGNPIPLSSIAKLASDRVPFVLGFLVYGSAFLGESGWLIPESFLLAVGIVALVVWRQASLGHGLLLIWSVVYVSLAAAFAGSFPWYYAPLLPGIAIAAASGARFASRLPAVRGGIQQALFLLVSAALVAVNLSLWAFDWRAYRGGAFDHRFEAYHAVSAGLLARAEAGDALAAAEIGYIGYATDMRVLDFYGLVTPAVHPWLPRGQEFAASQLVQLYAPEFVLVDTRRAPVEAYGIDHRYAQVGIFGGTYSLFERKDSR